MALVICPDCKKQISSNAASCPHCGNPNVPKPFIPTPRKKGKYEDLIVWVTIITVVALVGGGLFYGGDYFGNCILTRFFL